MKETEKQSNRFFKSEETDRLFMRWLNENPYSWHPLDMERFHEFLLSLLKNNEELTEKILTDAISATQKRVKKDFIKDMFDRYRHIRDFWEFSIEKNKISIK
jgi:hypothetical protein